MLNKFEISAEPRTAQGKGASRRLRNVGKIPAILYGANKAPVSIQLNHNQTWLQTENEAFYSHILTLKLDGAEEKVVVKDMQRHPVRQLIMHMDFLRINEAEELTLRVPLHFTNEAISVGVKVGGGVISHQMVDLEIMCLPRDLPEFVEVDLTEMTLGHTLHLADLKLPAGVRIASLVHGGEASLPVVSCHLPRTAEAAETAEVGAAATPAAATPAAKPAAKS
ncbi:MAG: 50S ribosomal protein L25/general stress protein Ctc [Gammaproteobacteria bacterium]|nr:50S ribosomal protein L25/general stress protein Ctc [Gammaproteobacteria bacterium]